jgi:prepilin-type N-terminal cleavage/methylation domain-containing protein
MKMNRKGVTLIELIVVIVIIGIGAVLFAPNIGAWLPNYRLRGAARDVVSTMRTAQMKAVSTNMTYRVSLTQTPASYVLQYQNTLGNWVTEGVTQNFPSGISISAINFAGNNAVFNPNSTSSSGSLTLQNTRQTVRRLTVTPSTGRITIQRVDELGNWVND